MAAGFSSGSQADTPLQFDAKALLAFSKKVERTLADKGARVAILARMGRPLSEMPEGMHFTHVAFAVYSVITTSDGRQIPGYAIYNLYQKDAQPDRSELVMDYPADFFAGVAVMEAGVIIPSPELQARLLNVIGTPTYQKLHDPHYSLIANPFNEGRQNCTEFVLDVIQAAIYQTSDIRTIQTNLKAHFSAQEVKVNPFKLMLGSMFSQEISLSDQTGGAVTATFEKIGEYLRKYDPQTQVFTVLPE